MGQLSDLDGGGIGIGGVGVGHRLDHHRVPGADQDSGHPVVVQSMTNTDTADADATAIQVAQLAHAGSELVRVTVNNDEAAAQAVPVIREKLDRLGVGVPLIGDFHYNGHLLLTKVPRLRGGARQVPHQPGQRRHGKRHDEQFAQIVEVAIANGKPVRIGVNWGSLDQQLLTELMDANAALPEPREAATVMIEAMLESALRSAALAEETGLAHDHIILSAKVSGVQDLIEVYARLGRALRLPAAPGADRGGAWARRASSPPPPAWRSCCSDGIGDTIRVSLTPAPGGDRTEEVRVAQQVLQSHGPAQLHAAGERLPRLRPHHHHLLPGDGPRDPATTCATRCPCGASATRGSRSCKVAVMGCVVNGPGESKHADIGISLPGTFEEPVAPVFVDGELITTLRGEDIVPRFLEILDEYVERRFPEPGSAAQG